MITIDDSEFPLIVSRWSGAVSDADIDTYVSHMHRVAARAISENAQFVVVAGTGERVELPAAQRKHMNDGLQTFSDRELKHWFAITVNLDSMAARGLLRALQWIARGSSTAVLRKVRTFATLEEAMGAGRALVKQAREA